MFMKNEILDAPILDTFDDLLEKDEKIIWTGFSAEIKDSFYDKKEDGSSSFNFGKFLVKILDMGIEFLTGVGIAIAYIAFSWFIEPENWKFHLLLLVLILSIFSFSLFKKTRRSNQYAITPKRILFQFARLPKDEIYILPFSEIKNCIVTLDSNNYGILFLATKNPNSLPAQLFEEDRHSPTFERIENPEEVAALIRNGIKNANKLL